MLQNHTPKLKSGFICLLLMIAGFTTHAQKLADPQPVWWFGQSVGLNFNQFRGTTQMLNKDVTVPTAFHQGRGIKPYISLLTEYRPNKTWGGMLNIAYDNRGGKFNTVIAPCNCPATLSTNVAYIAIEPSLRIAPFSNAFYIFAGPTLNFNISRSFVYKQDKVADLRGDWSDIRETVISGQAGLGIDIPLSGPQRDTKVTLSPFGSFQTDFGHEPRSVESWSFYTIRAGVALKFGTVKRKPIPVQTNTIYKTDTVYITRDGVVTDKDVQFSVRAPKMVPSNRRVKETFPLRKSVFFDMGSTEIPARYVSLNQNEAAAFKEDQLQESQPNNLSNGRAARQLAVYHNILNILGDRLRANPNSNITLTGASDNDPAQGKLMAENVKKYLINNFGISPARIFTEGRDKPEVPSEQPGGTKELDLLRMGDRRVDITSRSTELLMQVGGATSDFLRPVQINAFQEDPLDSHVIFYNTGANELLSSWSIEATDEQGAVQNYGPYTLDQASVPGKMLLAGKTQGNYKIVMRGQTKAGSAIVRESSVSLMKAEDSQQEGMRYSILFDFDKSKTKDVYEQFLINVVAPLIADNATVIIHGHTDIIGEEIYNLNLSKDRANETQRILERALANSGKRGVKFETYGFGEDAGMSPFENNLVEERFYNRTVIIDIVPNK